MQLPRNSPLNPMAVNIVQQDDRSEAESLRSTGGSQARQAPQDQDMRTHRGKSDSATTAEVKDQEVPSSAIEKPSATSATNGQSTGKRRRGRPRKGETTPASAPTATAQKGSVPAGDPEIELLEGEPQSKRTRKGREPGALGYTNRELFHLLRLIRKLCPYGERKWKKVANAHARWAERNGRPLRNAAALRAKFLAVCLVQATPYSLGC